MTRSVEARPSPGRWPGFAAFAILGVLATAALVGVIRSGANGDSAWILHAAGRMGAGERLYVDLVEMNPPLVFWGHVPIAAVARAFGADAWVVLVLGVLLVCAAAGMLLVRAMRAGKVDASDGAALQAAFALTAVVLPVGWFAQREHLLLVLIWPLLAVTMARLAGRDVAPALAASAGLAAGIGLALKPPALIVWPALAGLLFVRGRTVRSVIQPEHAALAAVLAAYTAATLLFAPDFLPVMRSLAPLYLEYAPRSLSSILFGGFQAWTVWAALIVWIAGGRFSYTPPGMVLGVAAAAFLVSVAAQGKGFGYHYYPAFGCAVALLLIIAFGDGASGLVRRGAAAAVLLMLSALFVPVLVSRAAGEAQRRDLERAALAGFVRDSVTPGGAVMVLSPRLGDAFPLISETGTRFALRYPHLWWMASMERLREQSDEDRVTVFEPLEAELRRNVAEDLVTNRPVLIIARNPEPSQRYAGDAPVDPISYLADDSTFAEALAGYRPAGRVAGFDLYLLRQSSSGGALR